MTDGFESLRKGLELIELAGKIGGLRVTLVAEQLGWTRAQASRYLRALAQMGWLRDVGVGPRRPVWVLGPKAVRLLPEVRLDRA